MNRKQNKLNPLRLAAAYLLLLTLISTGVSFAKYATSTDGTGNARVAAFQITTTLSGATHTLNTTDGAASYTHSFTVTNSSEVAVQCSITVDGIPSGVTVNCKLGSTDKGTVTNGTAVAVGAMAPGGTTETITLSFSVPQKTKLDASQISITVNAVQIG